MITLITLFTTLSVLTMFTLSKVFTAFTLFTVYIVSTIFTMYTVFTVFNGNIEFVLHVQLVLIGWLVTAGTPINGLTLFLRALV